MAENFFHDPILLTGTIKIENTTTKYGGLQAAINMVSPKSRRISFSLITLFVLNAKLKFIAMIKKERLMVIASYDKDDIWYKVIGSMLNAKNSHFRTGVVRMAIKRRSTETSKLKILPR